ncbi:MAG TPA: branched-chain amino acid aminotransferase [Devosiaceae bacterium]|nr:branched-chain amino acid aminotransferase [Devosiaceae bacterium]
MAGVPLDQRDGWIWFDGKFVDWKEAKVHVLTHAMHYGSGVFEGLRAYGGEIYKLRQHSDRLINSARILDFQIPYSAQDIDDACLAVLKKNGLTDAYIRPIAWRGSHELGLYARGNPVHLAIAAWEWPSYFKPEERLKGIRLTVSKWRRPAPDTSPFDAKATGLYMICTLSKHAATDAGYTDALMLDYRGQIAEATGANIFFHRHRDLHTPTPDCFLDGITRQTVIELARAHGLKVIVRPMLPQEMAEFDECFLTGTAAEVTPVAEIDAYRFTPGEVCRAMMDAYSAKVQPRRAAAE